MKSISATWTVPQALTGSKLKIITWCGHVCVDINHNECYQQRHELGMVAPFQ